MEKVKRLMKTNDRGILSLAWSAWAQALMQAKRPLVNSKLLALGDRARRSKHGERAKRTRNFLQA